MQSSIMRILRQRLAEIAEITVQIDIVFVGTVAPRKPIGIHGMDQQYTYAAGLCFVQQSLVVQQGHLAPRAAITLFAMHGRDRKSVVKGKSVALRVDPGGHLNNKKKNTTK